MCRRLSTHLVVLVLLLAFPAAAAAAPDRSDEGVRPTMPVEMRPTTGEHPVFLIYGYKTATFWPFVPTGKEQERDNAEELKLKAELEKELPIEPDLSRWLALFDAPLDD